MASHAAQVTLVNTRSYLADAHGDLVVKIHNAGELCALIAMS